MAAAVLDGSGEYGFKVNDGVNYGCAGRAAYSAFAGSIGKPVDDTDKAFHSWKNCVKCAASDPNGILEYVYDAVNDTCSDSSFESRPFCECDRILINYLYDAPHKNSDYEKTKCSSGKKAIS